MLAITEFIIPALLHIISPCFSGINYICNYCIEDQIGPERKVGPVSVTASPLLSPPTHLSLLAIPPNLFIF
nr:hypothetical protein Q903MT_gene5058 [Picea sitchensis]